MMNSIRTQQVANDVCAARETLGYAALADYLGISDTETRRLVAADWAATNDDAMFVYVLELGEQRLSELSGGTVTATDVSDFIESAIC